MNDRIAMQTLRMLEKLRQRTLGSRGGGLSAWGLFSLEQIREVTHKLFSNDGPATLHYRILGKR